MMNDAQETNMGCWERENIIQFGENVASFGDFPYHRI